MFARSEVIERLDEVLVERMKDLASRLTTAARGLLCRAAYDVALVTHRRVFDSMVSCVSRIAGSISNRTERKTAPVGSAAATQCAGAICVHRARELLSVVFVNVYHGVGASSTRSNREFDTNVCASPLLLPLLPLLVLTSIFYFLYLILFGTLQSRRS